jgi:hypothetical protein
VSWCFTPIYNGLALFYKKLNLSSGFIYFAGKVIKVKFAGNGSCTNSQPLLGAI